MLGVRRLLLPPARLLPAALLCVLIAATTSAQPPKPPEAPMPRPAGAPAAGEMAVLTKEAYIRPPKVIEDAVLASRGEIVTLDNLSPDGKKFLIARRDALPALDRLGCPCVHLAEMAFDPVARRARNLWVNSFEALDLFYPMENKTVRVRMPAGARAGSPVWSPDGSQLAFFAFFPDATHICVADTETGSCRQVTRTPVLATLVSTFHWSKDGKRIQTVLMPDEGKRAMPKLGVATEPKVRVARDGKNPSRTYRYLLESPYEMELLEYLCTGQLALVNVSDGSVTNVGPPGMIRTVNASPIQDQFRVGTVKKPFSYFAPFTSFGATEGIWNLEGKSQFTLSDRNLRDTAPPADPTPNPPTPKGKGGRPGATQPDPKTVQPPVNPDDPPQPQPEPEDAEGRRNLGWRPDGKGMSFLQREPANPKDEKAVRKDRVMQWLPPFGKDDVKVVYETPAPIAGVQYSADCKWIFLTQTIDNQRQITGINLDDPTKTYVISRSAAGAGGFEPKKGGGKKGNDGDDQLDDDTPDDEQPPAGFRGGAGTGLGLMSRSLGGVNVVRISGKGEVYISGTDRARAAGADATFPKPYIDAISIRTGQKTRVFEGKGDMLETVEAVDNDDITRVYTTRQKSDVVPDSYMTDLATKQTVKLTSNVDRAPWVHKLKSERFRVTRVDGFKFWVRVTLPPDAKGKLPALFWIYPREYTDQAAYDARGGAGGGGGGGPGGAGGGRFVQPTPRDMRIFTLAGYAVVEPDIPIVGPAGRMNDNYIPDLRNSLWAVIDECDKRGIIDRDRLACGGHSYGAFSTANAMAHTPFFKAGIAGDGCYNRTLTSMSFQTERRMLWDARETYLEMSPLLWADRVNGALLMYHGMEDANVGTNPINSEALFAALDGLGKDAAMYMYPYEGHGPISKETTLDLWARWVAWLDLYVKAPKKK